MENCSRANRAMFLAGGFGDELRKKYTGKRSKSDDELLSFPALASDYQGPFRKLAEAYSAAAEKHQSETGARLSLDEYLRRQWLSAFEGVKRAIVDGALEA
jgi:hypothetical protein